MCVYSDRVARCKLTRWMSDLARHANRVRYI